MPIYKRDGSGKFVPFEQTPFPDLEQVLEDWIEANPHIVLEGEEIAIFARQPRTAFDKYLDLLGVDKTGATVVIELKRGETPRDVIAQTLEYAAWVDSLTIDQLDEMARDYGLKHGQDIDGLASLYISAFPSESEDGEEQNEAGAERVTFNHRQRLVIVAERITDEVEQTLRYLRTRYGSEVYGVQFSVHRAGDDMIVSTTTVVGREAWKPPQPSRRRERESDEHIREKVKTAFLGRAVTAIEDWVAELKIDELRVDHSTGSEHFVRYLGITWLYYYYAENWLYFVLYAPSEKEVQLLREGLSKPIEIRPYANSNYRFHVATDEDLETVKKLIVQRVAAHRANTTVPA